jgi:hypothetical protein
MKSAYDKFKILKSNYFGYLDQLIILAKENKDEQAAALIQGDMGKSG